MYDPFAKDLKYLNELGGLGRIIESPSIKKIVRDFKCCVNTARCLEDMLCDCNLDQTTRDYMVEKLKLICAKAEVYADVMFEFGFSDGIEILDNEPWYPKYHEDMVLLA